MKGVRNSSVFLCIVKMYFAQLFIFVCFNTLSTLVLHGLNSWSVTIKGYDNCIKYFSISLNVT
jgi:hypothetical protein